MRRQSTFVKFHTSNPLVRNNFLIWVVGEQILIEIKLFFFIIFLVIMMVVLKNKILKNIIHAMFSFYYDVLLVNYYTYYFSEEL